MIKCHLICDLNTAVKNGGSSLTVAVTFCQYLWASVREGRGGRGVSRAV